MPAGLGLFPALQGGGSRRRCLFLHHRATHPRPRPGSRREGAHGAVQPLHDLGRHGVGAADDLARPCVGAAGLALLLVGERHDPQGENLVDLGRVAEIALALRRDPGVVVENDGRRQHHVMTPLRADEHRPGVQVDAGGGRRNVAAGGGSSSETKAPPRTASRVLGAEQRSAQRQLSIGTTPAGQGASSTRCARAGAAGHPASRAVSAVNRTHCRDQASGHGAPGGRAAPPPGCAALRSPPLPPR